ncbi:MAG TPA: Bax inhibitor-1/YccA family protein [Flavipsychrobacter sp.]|nr:Bax inhibitor-1/YccA family protein [Flavipsychrobacter sp.]
MENYNQQRPFTNYTVLNTDSNVATQEASRKFMANVFLWMFVALGVSTLFAFLFAENTSLLSYLIDLNTGKMNMLGWIVLFSPIGFVLLMNFGYQRLSLPVLALLFLAYSAITGISLSFVLLAYTSTSLIGCFASSAATFGVMAIMGYTTKQDLTSFGRILYMALIGVLISFFINFFLHSPTLDYVISIVGVAVFTGLTAYDVQKLKRIGAGAEYEGVSADDTKKLSVLGALSLYLDFINLFLMMLRLFGRRR